MANKFSASRIENDCGETTSGVPEIGRIHIRDRIKELRRVRAKDLLPNGKNWRRHPPAQVAALRGLLDEIGYVDVLIARELPDGRLGLIDGHLRRDTTPDQEVPVIVLDVTEKEADKILATLDPLAAMAEMDSERITSLLATVQTNSEAVKELLKRTVGDRIWEIVHPADVAELEVSPDRAEALCAKWKVETGQLWQAGPHRLVCGDCRDRDLVARLWTATSRSLRMIWSDPPYGVSYSEKTNWLNTHRSGPSRRPIENDSLKPDQLQKLFAMALEVSRTHALPGAVIYATVPGAYLKYFIAGLEDGGFSYRACLVWVKQNFVIGRGDYHFRHEPILYGWIENGPHYFAGDRSHDSVFEVDRPMASELHPTTKPVELIGKMIANSSRVGDVVYDPFAGSGSTVVAAHQLGRIGYACELDPAYVAVQLERLSLLGLEPKQVRES